MLGGGAHLNLGDWYRARNIWQYAQPFSAYYKILQNELLKLHSYPMLRQSGNSAPIALEYDEVICTSNKLTKGRSFVHVSRTPVISIDDCNRVITWAEEHAAKEGSWTTSRHYAVPTTDIPVHVVPPLLNWFNRQLEEIIGPLLHQQYSDFSSSSCSALCVHDVFVCKYEAGKTIGKERLLKKSGEQSSMSSAPPQRLLPLHMDQSTHSFVIALNSPVLESNEWGDGDFVGGGTFFPELGTTICPGAGALVTFKGGTTLHGGAPVQAGTRYIIAGFLYFSNSNLPSDKCIFRHLTTRDNDLLPTLLYDTRDEVNKSCDEVNLVVSQIKESIIDNSMKSLVCSKTILDLSKTCGDYTFSSANQTGSDRTVAIDDENASPAKKPRVDFSNSESHSFSFDF